MSLRHPVGPLPAAVYWRRRVVVVGVPLVLIGALAYSCAATGGNGSSPVAKGGPKPSATATTSTTTPITETPGPSTSVVPGDGGIAGGSSSPTGTTTGTTPAAPGSSTAAGGSTSTGAVALNGCALRLQVSTDQGSYGAGANPRVTVTAVNMGNANCTLDVSGKGLVVSVLTPSGSVVWTTSDCRATTDERALSSGDIYTETVTWDRHGSVPNRCESGQPAVPTGYYDVDVAVDGLTSTKVPFQLTS